LEHVTLRCNVLCATRQLGWFSLGGRDNQQPPMGIYDQLMSPEYDAEIAYLRAQPMQPSAPRPEPPYAYPRTHR
jgi:hypothetical protein